jgi:hypothetical protein
MKIMRLTRQPADKRIEVWTDEIEMNESMLEDNDKRSDPIYLVDYQDLSKFNSTIIYKNIPYMKLHYLFIFK